MPSAVSHAAQRWLARVQTSLNIPWSGVSFPTIWRAPLRRRHSWSSLGPTSSEWLAEVWGQQVETALRLYDQHRRGWSIRRGGAARWQRGRHLPPTRGWVRAHPLAIWSSAADGGSPPASAGALGLGASSSPSAGENRARSRTPASGAGLGVPRQEKGP